MLQVIYLRRVPQLSQLIRVNHPGFTGGPILLVSFLALNKLFSDHVCLLLIKSSREAF